MMRGFRRFWRNQGGSSAVEFSMVLFPFTVMLFGGFEFARLSWTREALQEVAIAGSRCMGLLASSCASAGAYSAANSKSFMTSRALKFGITLPAANITASRTATCAGVSNFSSVTVAYTFETVVPGLVDALADGQALTASACFPNNK